MAKNKWKKYLWPKKTSRKVLMTCIYIACIYLILGGFGIVPLIAATTGFANWGADSINGYDVGTNQFTQSGMFDFNEGGIRWQGRVVMGNMYYDGNTELGFLQNGNQSIALRALHYHASILTYLLQPYTNMLPGIGTVQNGIIGTQYSYKTYDILSNHIAAADVNAYLRANYLSIPSNYVTLLTQYLNLNVGFHINLDHTLLGIQSYTDGTQYFNCTGVWTGVLSANANAVYESGLISAPGTTILNANFTQTPTDPAAGSASGYSASNVGTTGDITDWINAHDPAGYGHHFDVTAASSTMYAAGAAELGMGAGDPVVLTEGIWNANATINQTETVLGMLGDNYRNYVEGYVPVTLRPETTITQTTYTYNEFNLLKGFWSGLQGTALLGRTVTVATAITIQNPFVINHLGIEILCAANYTVSPLSSGYPDIEVPIVNGTDTVFNAALTSQVHDVSGDTGLDITDFMGFLGSFGGWIIAILLISIAAVLVWRFAKPGKKRK